MRFPCKPVCTGKPAALRLIAQGGERSRTAAGKPLTWLWAALLGATLPAQAGFCALSVSGNEGVDLRLRQLSARASNRETWPALLSYATSAGSTEQRGQAYLVLGYHEYEAEEFRSACTALREAALTQFSLADFAEYYWASAAQEDHEPGQIVEALRGFSLRHPNSPFRLSALELLVNGYLALGQPDQAIEALNREPKVRQTPSLALLLAQAYLRARKFQEAAKAFQQVYYALPTSDESEEAVGALRDLETRLGSSFPTAGEELETLRADALFDHSQFRDALKEYDLLLRTRARSLRAGQWKLGRARCQLRLREYVGAVETLEGLVTRDPEVDAWRLATLAEADAHLDDREMMLQELDELAKGYAHNPAYASAIAFAASWFWRRGNLAQAAQYDRLLSELFPGTDLGREGNWNLAWNYYLERHSDKARRALSDHIARYPASAHVPAALYWLGRLAEQSTNPTDARLLYEFLNKRFPHSYYSLLASSRLKDIPPPPPEADGKSKKGRPKLGAYASPIQKVPARQMPAVRPCAPSRISDLLRPYVTLTVLSLHTLAVQYLAARLSEQPNAPDLLLALSRLKAQAKEYSAALLRTREAVPNYSEYDFQDLPQEIWDLLFPRPFVEVVRREARANGLDPSLVMGVIRQESAFDPHATSRANARGLMQILPQTAHPSRRGRTATSKRLYDPDYNIQFGCRYLHRLVEAFNGSLEQALAAYNAGDPRVNNWAERGQFREPAEFLETIPIRETRAYVEAVLRDAEIYRRLMDGTAKFKICR